jgi:hypothetical protein|nr:MAG TPA: putative ATP-dependent serine protease [Caudoviricetes sp.]
MRDSEVLDNGVRRAYSADSVISMERELCEFDGQWLEAVGKPELKGTWCIGGLPKNGKTSFTMQLAKYLTRWHLVAYNSIEEGISASFAETLRRCRMDEVKANRFIVLNNEDIKDIECRLSKRKSPKIVIIDSIQFLGLNTETYLRWKKRFSEKLFIYITHLQGQYPEGKTALKIWRDSDVVVKVEGFRAYPTSRYGGGKPITISEDKAAMFELQL